MTEILECTTVNRPYLLGKNRKTGEFLLYRPDCKLWSCPHCANVKAKQWAARVRVCIRDNPEKDWHFLTVTIEEDSGLLTRQIEIWRDAWDTFSKRMRRAAGEKLTYVAIPELSPVEKRLHCHMILDWNCERNMYQSHYVSPKTSEGYWRFYSRWLHDNLKPSGLGYIYDIQELSSPNLGAYYITKYIGKGLSEAFPKGFRRVRTSMGFPEIEIEDVLSEYDWEVVKANGEGRERLLYVLLSGKIVHQAGTHKPVTMKHELIQPSHFID